MIDLDRRTLLTGAAATLATPALGASNAPRPFPSGFLWGVSTAGHQIEGNNVNSDAWALEHVRPTAYAEPSGDAANSFALWPRDLDLVRGMGLGTYRFSLEWARIEPEPGQFSLAMLDHYKAVIAGCHERGISPSSPSTITPRRAGSRRRAAGPTRRRPISSLVIATGRRGIWPMAWAMPPRSTSPI
jgi:hypothetical protein